MRDLAQGFNQDAGLGVKYEADRAPANMMSARTEAFDWPRNDGNRVPVCAPIRGDWSWIQDVQDVDKHVPVTAAHVGLTSYVLT